MTRNWNLTLRITRKKHLRNRKIRNFSYPFATNYGFSKQKLCSFRNLLKFNCPIITHYGIWKLKCCSFRNFKRLLLILNPEAVSTPRTDLYGKGKEKDSQKSRATHLYRPPIVRFLGLTFGGRYNLHRTTVFFALQESDRRRHENVSRYILFYMKLVT